MRNQPTPFPKPGGHKGAEVALSQLDSCHECVAAVLQLELDLFQQQE